MLSHVYDVLGARTIAWLNICKEPARRTIIGLLFFSYAKACYLLILIDLSNVDSNLLYINLRVIKLTPHNIQKLKYIICNLGVKNIVVVKQTKKIKSYRIINKNHWNHWFNIRRTFVTFNNQVDTRHCFIVYKTSMRCRWRHIVVLKKLELRHVSTGKNINDATSP